MNERRELGPGGSGDGGSSAPRASVALTADQWSAVVMVLSHGVGHVRDSKTIPIAIINRCLRDVAAATQVISERLECEALRRGKPE